MRARLACLSPAAESKALWELRTVVLAENACKASGDELETSRGLPNAALGSHALCMFRVERYIQGTQRASLHLLERGQSFVT